MSRSSGRSGSGFSPLNIVRAVSVLVVVALFVGTGLERSRNELRYPPPGLLNVDEAPIEAEAGVFRVGKGDLAVALDFEVARPAHPRNLEFVRRLRAYPGAPPRIPHGLTREEYTEVRCNICHERGGWVARFATYAPVTPHPEQASCLQCHLPLDELVARPLPASESLVCAQCHVDPEHRPLVYVASDWRPGSWPVTDRQAMPGAPHLIPHEVRSRNNCLACHGAPGSTEELRIGHPERSNCLQCHLPVAVDGDPDAVFVPSGPPEVGDDPPEEGP